MEKLGDVLSNSKCAACPKPLNELPITYRNGEWYHQACYDAERTYEIEARFAPRLWLPSST